MVQQQSQTELKEDDVGKAKLIQESETLTKQQDEEIIVRIFFISF